MPVRCHERPHVLGCLCERKLESSNRCEDFGETDKHVGHGLGPDVDRGWVVAAVHVFAARALGVDVMLDDGSGNHRERCKDETEGDALNGSEADVCLAESGVEEVVNDGNEDDQGDGVEVSDDIVGNTVTGHCSGLRREVVVHLVVAQPVKRNPGEARARAQATSNLVNPSVVKLHPGRLVRTEVARLDVLPETLALKVLAGSRRVERPLALSSELQDLKGADEDGTSGGSADVLVSADPKDDRAEAEHDGG